jgi:RNA polymerase sigma-70 factor, ECF subfamily
MSALASATMRTLDPTSRAWLVQLHAEGPVREAAVGRLHALLLREAGHEVRRRTAGLAHPSGRDLEDLAIQAADDAVVVLLRKLDQFRGEALFTTWARRFAALEVPGEIRRRLGHTREAPTDGNGWPPEQATYEDPEQRMQAGELARAVGYLIAHELTAHQREVLLALTIDEITAHDLATRLHSTPGAVYKTLHDARRKLKHKLPPDQQLVRSDHPASVASGARVATPRVAATPFALAGRDR